MCIFVVHVLKFGGREEVAIELTTFVSRKKQDAPIYFCQPMTACDSPADCS